MTPLARLLAAVEAGDDIDELRRDMARNARDLGIDFPSHDISKAYYGQSTDAAISLIEAMLPGWTAIEIVSRSAKARWVAEVSREVDDVELCMVGRADTPARALLIAALRALVAQEDGA